MTNCTDSMIRVCIVWHKVHLQLLHLGSMLNVMSLNSWTLSAAITFISVWDCKIRKFRVWMFQWRALGFNIIFLSEVINLGDRRPMVCFTLRTRPRCHQLIEFRDDCWDELHSQVSYHGSTENTFSFMSRPAGLSFCLPNAYCNDLQEKELPNTEE